jgi:hypothetical protein
MAHDGDHHLLATASVANPSGLIASGELELALSASISASVSSSGSGLTWREIV